jgi:hypothetical protein
VPEKTTRLIHDADVIAQSTGDTIVLFQMQSGGYFSLTGCGSRIWECCDGTKTAQEIAEILRAEYDAPPELSADVDSFLSQLESRGLLKPAEE